RLGPSVDPRRQQQTKLLKNFHLEKFKRCCALGLPSTSWPHSTKLIATAWRSTRPRLSQSVIGSHDKHRTLRSLHRNSATTPTRRSLVTNLRCWGRWSHIGSKPWALIQTRLSGTHGAMPIPCCGQYP